MKHDNSFIEGVVDSFRLWYKYSAALFVTGLQETIKKLLY